MQYLVDHPRTPAALGNEETVGFQAPTLTFRTSGNPRDTRRRPIICKGCRPRGD